MNQLKTSDYKNAVSGDSTNHALNSDWEDKPHRLIYDLCNEIDRLKKQLSSMKLTIKKLEKASINNKLIK